MVKLVRRFDSCPWSFKYFEIGYKNKKPTCCFTSIWSFISSQYSALLTDSSIMDDLNMDSEGANDNDNHVNGVCHRDEHGQNQRNVHWNFGPRPLIAQKQPFLERLPLTTANLHVTKIQTADAMHTRHTNTTYRLISLDDLRKNGPQHGTILLCVCAHVCVCVTGLRAV